MQIHVDTILRFTWPAPAAGIVGYLRLTPRQSDRQQIVNWRIDVDADGCLTQTMDPFGNDCHIFYADRPLDMLEIEVTGLVNTSPSSGAILGFDDLLPPAIYRRQTPLTSITPPVALFAEGFRREDRIATLHALMAGVHEHIHLEPGAICGPAEAALADGKGRAEDMAHLFIAASRHLGYPARFVSGLLAEDGRVQLCHAWAQAYVDGLGWTHFDPSLNVSISEAHLTIAVGLDSNDAVPVRVASRNGGVESLAVGVRGRESVQDELQRQS